MHSAVNSGRCSRLRHAVVRQQASTGCLASNTGRFGVPYCSLGLLSALDCSRGCAARCMTGAGLRICCNPSVPPLAHTLTTRVQAFRHILLYLRALYAAESSGLKPNKQPAPNLPSSRDELTILLSECQFYELPDLEIEVAKALKAAPTVTQSITPGGTVSATTVAGVVDDTTDIYSKASRMQLEFQSVYVTISSSNGLQFTEEERRTAMAEVNARTAELQGSGFRVKAMNTGVAQDRKTKDYCMCELIMPALFACHCIILWNCHWNLAL